MKTLSAWAAPALSIVILLAFLGLWHAGTMQEAGKQVVTDEYAKLVGGAAATGQKSSLPTPGDVGRKIWEHLNDPFYDKGPNDKGIGIQLGYSIARVLTGYLLAALVAIPVGFLIGMSPLVYRALAQLRDASLTEDRGTSASDAGPARTTLGATKRGRSAFRRWRAGTVEHVRDLRSELMLKLLFHQRAGLDSTPLLREQARLLAGTERALEQRLASTEGFDRTLVLWRLSVARAALSFVESLLDT